WIECGFRPGSIPRRVFHFFLIPVTPRHLPVLRGFNNTLQYGDSEGLSLPDTCTGSRYNSRPEQ
ncbi:MAG: hypothetical protein V2J19_11585, partial [Wenzhouxiangella sp.]|nr:hypothetical protein [Wenzhouxiangella sp.]